MSRVVLPSKLANEIKRYKLDFIGELSVGETIATAVAIFSVYSGGVEVPPVVPGPSATCTINGSIVSVLISGGTAGMLYFMVLRITTSAGQTLDKEGFLSVIPSTS